MTELPAGSVTFLFTDIEGSTRLLGQYPKAYAAALLRHDALLRSAVAGQNGVVFETIGDAVYAAFRDPIDAVRTALDAQRGLQAEEWGELGQLRVRMAVHTGDVERRGEHYFGAPLYRCARLMAIGHGGQTLLSSVTAEAVRERLPGSLSLRPMGVHRLKDLAELEEVFQLGHPDLATDFPPLKSLDPRATNLPPQTTSFVGRQTERTELARILEANRLLTLTGTGGTGKTRLGLQVAADLLPAFDHGVFFVSLASISDSELVGPVIAQTLGVPEEPREPIARTLSNYLRAKELLLVLDNFEQVAAAAPLVGDLLSACPKLKALVTSRVALHLSMEQQFEVPPLELPDLRRDAADPLRLPRSDAVVLFLQRALAVNPRFPVTDRNLAAIAEICTGLEGLPLSIELAAARSKLLSPQAMLPLLRSRLALLSSGPRDKPDRQQSVRGAIAWSYDLLSTDEQRLFARLAVFVGGFTLGAAEAVCEADLDRVAALLDKSLLRREDDRYSMLETIREYALERLTETGESEGIRQLHARWYTEFAERINLELESAVGASAGQRLEQDHDNLRTAIRGALERGDSGTALRLATALGAFWCDHGYLREGLAWLNQALSQNPPEATTTRARAHNLLGSIAARLGEWELARPHFEMSLRFAREVGAERTVGNATMNLGLIALGSADYDAAYAHFQEGRAVLSRGGTDFDIALVLNNIASVELMRGHPAQAADLLTEGTALARKIANDDLLAVLLTTNAMTRLIEGDLAAATASNEEALDRGLTGGDNGTVVESIEMFAAIWSAREWWGAAARMFGFAEAFHASTEIMDPYDQALFAPHIARVRTALSPDALASAWSQGSVMTLDAAIADVRLSLAVRTP